MSSSRLIKVASTATVPEVVTTSILPGGGQLKFRAGAVQPISAERKAQIDRERECFRQNIEADVRARLDARRKA